MMTNTHPLATAWLDRVAELSIGMPEDRRRELLADLREHLDVALTDDPDPATVDGVLARMGDPADVVAAARDDLPPPAPATTMPPPEAGPVRHSTPERPTGAEITTLVLFVLSGLLLVLWPLAAVAWLVAVVLLVTRDRWEGVENLVALLLPFGFSIPWVVVGVVGFAAGECVTSITTDAGGNVSEVTNCGASGVGWTGTVLGLALLVVFLAAIGGVVWLASRVRNRPLVT